MGAKSPAGTGGVPGIAGAQMMLTGISAIIMSQLGVFVLFIPNTPDALLSLGSNVHFMPLQPQEFGES